MLVQLSDKNPLLAPKAWSTAFRVKVQAPYLDNADEIFNSLNWEVVQISLDWDLYKAVLNQELASSFKIIPGDEPLIEICLEVYNKSFDQIYNAKEIILILNNNKHGTSW